MFSKRYKVLTNYQAHNKRIYNKQEEKQDECGVCKSLVAIKEK